MGQAAFFPRPSFFNVRNYTIRFHGRISKNARSVNTYPARRSPESYDANTRRIIINIANRYYYEIRVSHATTISCGGYRKTPYRFNRQAKHIRVYTYCSRRVDFVSDSRATKCLVRATLLRSSLNHTP